MDAPRPGTGENTHTYIRMKRVTEKEIEKERERGLRGWTPAIWSMCNLTYSFLSLFFPFSSFLFFFSPFFYVIPAVSQSGMRNSFLPSFRPCFHVTRLSRVRQTPFKSVLYRRENRIRNSLALPYPFTPSPPFPYESSRNPTWEFFRLLESLFVHGFLHPFLFPFLPGSFFSKKDDFRRRFGQILFWGDSFLIRSGNEKGTRGWSEWL